MRPRLLFLSLLLLGLLVGACGHSGGTIPDAGIPPDNGPDAPADLAYAQRVYVLAIGETVTAQTPTVTGTVELYAVSPALPDGLSLDSTTGEISGAPTAYTARASYEITASNFDGADRILLIFQVGGASRFAFGGSTSDGSIAEFGVQPVDGSLFHGGWIGGPATGLSHTAISEEGDIVCVVDDLELSTLLVDPLSGRLLSGSSAGLGSGPHSLALHPSGDFVFVTTRGVDLLRSYSVDPDTGELSLVSQITTGFEPRQVVADPLGRYLIVRHTYDATVGNDKTPTRSYTIDQETGELTESATFNIFGTQANEMILGSVGESLYLTLLLPSPQVLHCTVDTETGLPTPLTLNAAGTDPVTLRVTPDGTRLYVINATSDDVTLFDIDSADGSLTFDTSLGTSSGADALSFSFDGAQLYIVDSAAQEITVQELNPGSGQFDASTTIRTRAGSLALLHVSGETGITRRAADLYVLNAGSEDMARYAIDSVTGALTDGTTIAAGTAPVDLAVDPRGRFIYASSPGTNEIIGYSIGTSGALTDLGLPTDLVGGTPTLLGMDPSGRYLFAVESAFQLLLSFEVLDDGSLSQIASEAMPDNPTSISVDPTGRFIYVSVGGDGTTLLGELRPFELDAKNANLTALPVIATPGFPSSVVFDPTGSQAYVTLRGADTIQTFDVNVDGSFTTVGVGSSSQSLPQHIALSTDGRFAYAAFQDVLGVGGLLLYDVLPATAELYDSSTGLLQWRDEVTAGDDPSQVLLSPDGLNAYVLGRTSEDVQVFDTDAGTGLATFLELQTPGSLPATMGLRVVRE